MNVPDFINGRCRRPEGMQLRLVLSFCLVNAQVLTDDPFYGKRVSDYPDYFARESRVKPINMQPRMLQTASLVGSEEEAARLFNLAGLTYCTDETTGVPGSEYVRGLGGDFQVSAVVGESHLEIRALVALDESRKQVLLAFRGTSSYRNWGASLAFNKVAFGPGAVHAGFKVLADALLPKYHADLMGLLGVHPEYQLVLVGHSLGGAMAVLSAALLARDVSWDRIAVYTYGQPRVGDRAFVEWLNSKPMRMTRVVNDNDSVPHLPPNFAGFFHAHTEMFLQADNATVCATQELEDAACSKSRVTLPSRTPHSSAFGILLDESRCGQPPPAFKGFLSGFL